MSGLFRFGFGHADGGDLRLAVGAARDVGGVQGMRVVARDLLNAYDTLVAGLVGEPRRAGDVTDSVEPLHARRGERVGLDV